MYRPIKLATPTRIASLLCLALLARHASGAEHHAASAADVERLAGQLQPGDTVVLADGTWTDQALVLHGTGNATKPITYRAATPGKVVLSGNSSVNITGAHVVVNGILLKDCSATDDGIKLTGTNCRLTESAVIGGQHKFFVHFFGLSNRMDHCYLAGKTNSDPTLEVEAERQPNHHLLDHNHFGHRPPLGRNGGETIRVGYSWQSMSNSCTTVERNLFDRCDGELEIISSKSCANRYRFNTFLDCAGTLTLRHGNRCVVEGNFFLAHHKRGSGGIRVIGEDHIIFNNYIDGVENGGLWITAGISNSELKGYFQARNCVIAFNTIVDCRGPSVNLDAGFGSSRRTLRPENITLANNLFSPATNGVVLRGTEGSGFKWLGNVSTGKTPGERPGIRPLDVKFSRAADGLWRPGADSPLRGEADGSFAQFKTDMDGQPRAGALDAGSDQISDAPITVRPLTAADVGPAWLSAAERSPIKP